MSTGIPRATSTITFQEQPVFFDDEDIGTTSTAAEDDAPEEKVITTPATTTKTHTNLIHSGSITSVADFNTADLQTEPCKNVQPKSPFAASFTNMCSASAGAKTLFATDDWFASADNILKDGPPLFIDDLYCREGKVMDGWETRRRREEGHDWCLIQLSERSIIKAVEVDTAHFTGNNTPKISIEIADLSVQETTDLVKGLPRALERMLHGGVQGTGTTPQDVQQALDATNKFEWKPLMSQTPLRPGFENTRMHYFNLSTPMEGTIIKLNYYPDGGVARLRLWGEDAEPVSHPILPMYMPIETGPICTVVKHSRTDHPPSRQPYEYPELSSQENGGQGLVCSNKHYGEPWHLLQSTLGKDMGDGWETARHPSRPAILHKDPETHLIDSPLTDWSILKLGSAASNGVARVIIDTKHFRGNYPESVLLEGAFCETSDDDVLQSNESLEWFPVIPRVRMSPDAEHVFERSLEQIQNASRPVTHVRVSIFPDGGLSRVRIYG